MIDTTLINRTTFIIAFSFLFSTLSSAGIYQIRSGDTLTHIMKRHGFTARNVVQATRSPAWTKYFPLITGDKYQFNPKTKRLKLYHPDQDQVLLILPRGQQVSLNSQKTNFSRRLKQVHGRVTGSLIQSIKKLLPNISVAYRFVDAFLPNLRPNRIQYHSKFSLTVEQLFDEGRFIKYGDIVSAQLDHRGESIAKNFFALGNSKVLFSKKDLESKRPFYAPVDQLKFASLFQPRRRHPITKRLQPHLGIDFEQALGSPVYAAAAGQVEKMGRGRAAGKYIVIRHKNGLRSYYNHLNDFQSSIKSGVWVFAGQRIGDIGCTGYCTKPHLHFAVKKRGRMINPIKLVRPYARHIERHLIEHVKRLSKSSSTKVL